MSARQFMELAAGIDDVLHPGGHQMFTDSAWQARFAPSDISF
jgi:hypothetical protein